MLKFLRDIYAPFLMKTPTRIAVLVLFTTLAAVSSWAISNLTIDFDSTLFIGDDHELKDYFDLGDRYFADVGAEAKVYTDTTAINTEANQQLLQTTFDNLDKEPCDGCS